MKAKGSNNKRVTGINSGSRLCLINLTSFLHFTKFFQCLNPSDKKPKIVDVRRESNKNEEIIDNGEVRQKADINSARLSVVMRKNRDYIEEIKQLKSTYQAQKIQMTKFNQSQQKLNGTKAKLHKIKSNYKAVATVAWKQQNVCNVSSLRRVGMSTNSHLLSLDLYQSCFLGNSTYAC